MFFSVRQILLRDAAYKRIICTQVQSTVSVSISEMRPSTNLDRIQKGDSVTYEDWRL